MIRRMALGLALAVLVALGAASPASAEFGISEFDVTFTNADGSMVTQAGSHPFEMTSSFHFISIPTGQGGEEAEEAAKDLLVDQPAGFIGSPIAVPRCANEDFLVDVTVQLPDDLGPSRVPACSASSAVGTVSVTVSSKVGGAPFHAAVYNLEPPPGVAAKLGFRIVGTTVTIELGARESPHITSPAGRPTSPSYWR